MKIKRTLQLSVFLALALMMLAASSVLAFDPPTWPQGIPWPTVIPWPTARPLAVGEHWSPDSLERDNGVTYCYCSNAKFCTGSFTCCSSTPTSSPQVW